eukprot:GILJ01001746.1.p1 GENE.GILJ01001746.1~~GILJ01001746.1.p1  ORF type:complete len:720 (+),score=122.45 GILJ01001746.1:132-2291(+)
MQYSLLPDSTVPISRNPTFKRKLFYGVATLLVATGVIVGVILAVSSSSGSNSSLASPSSLSSASASPDGLDYVREQIRSMVNFSADPCEDFNLYACGSWLESFPLPADRSRYSFATTGLDDENKKILRSILEDPSGEWPVIGPFYRSCMNAIPGEVTLLDSLFAMALQATEGELKHTFFYLGQLHRNAVPVLFDSGVSADAKDPSFNLFQLSQGGINLPSITNYKDDALLAKYRKHIETMYSFVRIDQDQAQTMSQAIVDVESHLASISKPPAELRDPEAVYHKTDLKQIEALTGFSAELWTAYFEGLRIDPSDPSRPLLNIMVPSFFQALRPVLENPKGLFYYLHWTVLHAHADLLGGDFAVEHFKFYGQELNGLQVQPPRWLQCVTATDAHLGELLGRYFVLLAFPGDSKAIVQDMVKRVEEAFTANLPNVDWMDESTREVAAQKVSQIMNQIGYPDKWKDYSSLNWENPSSYLSNTLQCKQLEKDTELDKLHKPVNKLEFQMTPPTVNAYYEPTLNQIVFPAGILGGFFFNHTFPAAINYGATASAIGHELSHGFDDEGRQFDGTGKLVPWWPEEVVKKFMDRIQCVDDLYSSYKPFPDLHLNGRLTMGENLADISGVKSAFTAYQNLVQSGGSKPQDQIQFMDEFTNDQLFYVAYAASWCEKQTPQALRNQVLTNPHSPAQYRIIAPLTQDPNFAQSFSCPAGSRMNPVNRCKVW